MLILTMGTFDILHFGHIGFLQRCQELGNELRVGVNTDEFAESFKRRPVMNLRERIHALEQLGYRVTPNDGPGRDLIEWIKPEIVATGSDWAGRDYHAQIGVTQPWLDDRGIILAYVPRVRVMPMSTSEIMDRVRGR